MNRITFQAVTDTPTAPAFKVGERGATPDGREWLYVKATTALAQGSVAIPGSTSVDTVASSQDAQGRNVYVTEASAGWTVGAYEDWWMYVDDGTGAGQLAKIKTNTADTLELYPEFALTTALTVAGASDITLTGPANVDKAAITSKVQGAVGIAQVAFAAGDYGWILTKGEGVVLAGEALVAGTGFVTGDDTTGQVVKATTAKGSYDEQTLGYCRVINAAVDTLAHVYVNIE